MFMHKCQVITDKKMTTNNWPAMMCAINSKIFFTFTKKSFTQDSGTLCYIINDDNNMFEVTYWWTGIWSSGSKAWQMLTDGCEIKYVLLNMKYNEKPYTNLLSFTCKLPDGSKQSNNIINSFNIVGK